ncbi:hypothetical protein SNEBB_002592 [Seison nebaliae]|nr:hypothetical protein SNEBB_002592 [Seison nebaliae]
MKDRDCLITFIEHAPENPNISIPILSPTCSLLQISSKFDYRQYENGNHLTIHNTKFSDGGTYHCHSTIQKVIYVIHVYDTGYVDLRVNRDVRNPRLIHVKLFHRRSFPMAHLTLFDFQNQLKIMEFPNISSQVKIQDQLLKDDNSKKKTLKTALLNFTFYQSVLSEYTQLKYVLQSNQFIKISPNFLNRTQIFSILNVGNELVQQLSGSIVKRIIYTINLNFRESGLIDRTKWNVILCITGILNVLTLLFGLVQILFARYIVFKSIINHSDVKQIRWALIVHVIISSLLIITMTFFWADGNRAHLQVFKMEERHSLIIAGSIAIYHTVILVIAICYHLVKSSFFGSKNIRTYVAAYILIFVITIVSFMGYLTLIDIKFAMVASVLNFTSMSESSISMGSSMLSELSNPENTAVTSHFVESTKLPLAPLHSKMILLDNARRRNREILFEELDEIEEKRVLLDGLDQLNVTCISYNVGQRMKEHIIKFINKQIDMYWNKVRTNKRKKETDLQQRIKMRRFKVKVGEGPDVGWNSVPEIEEFLSLQHEKRVQEDKYKQFKHIQRNYEKLQFDEMDEELIPGVDSLNTHRYVLIQNHKEQKRRKDKYKNSIPIEKAELKAYKDKHFDLVQEEIHEEPDDFQNELLRTEIEFSQFVNDKLNHKVTEMVRDEYGEDWNIIIFPTNDELPMSENDLFLKYRDEFMEKILRDYKMDVRLTEAQKRQRQLLDHTLKKNKVRLFTTKMAYKKKEEKKEDTEDDETNVSGSKKESNPSDEYNEEKNEKSEDEEEGEGEGEELEEQGEEEEEEEEEGEVSKSPSAKSVPSLITVGSDEIEIPDESDKKEFDYSIIGENTSIDLVQSENLYDIQSESTEPSICPQFYAFMKWREWTKDGRFWKHGDYACGEPKQKYLEFRIWQKNAGQFNAPLSTTEMRRRDICTKKKNYILRQKVLDEKAMNKLLEKIHNVRFELLEEKMQNKKAQKRFAGDELDVTDVTSPNLLDTDENEMEEEDEETDQIDDENMNENNRNWNNLRRKDFLRFNKNNSAHFPQNNNNNNGNGSVKTNKSTKSEIDRLTHPKLNDITMTLRSNSRAFAADHLALQGSTTIINELESEKVIDDDQLDLDYLEMEKVDNNTFRVPINLRMIIYCSETIGKHGVFA